MEDWSVLVHSDCRTRLYLSFPQSIQHKMSQMYVFLLIMVDPAHCNYYMFAFVHSPDTMSVYSQVTVIPHLMSYYPSPSQQHSAVMTTPSSGAPYALMVTMTSCLVLQYSELICLFAWLLHVLEGCHFILCCAGSPGPSHRPFHNHHGFQVN